MNNGQISPPPVAAISRTDQGKLPSLLETLKAYNRDQRNCNFFWFLFGFKALSFTCLGLVEGMMKAPWLYKYVASTLGADPYMLLFLISSFLGPVIFFYLVMISSLMPIKPVGRYLKHGFELAALFVSVILQLCDGYDGFDLLLCSEVICLFHAFCRLLRRPPDLGWSDWFLEQLMQVAACDNSRHVIVYVVICLMIICYRFYSYSCPEVPDQQINYQRLESEEPC